MTNSVPPGLILLAAGLSLPFIKNRHLRSTVVLAAPVVALAAILTTPEGPVLTLEYLGYEIMPLQRNNLSLVFASVFAVMAFAGGLFALNQPRVMELASAFVYAGSAICVTMAGDIVTVFIFWEIMAIGSIFVIWSSAEPNAGKSAMRYAQIHLLGGVLLMVGVIGHVAAAGTATFGPIALESVWAWLILAGFLINAGAPPLAAWLPDAYPEASWSGTVFLSAFTTKTAVYTLIVAFAGADILIHVGLYMACYGIVYALLENDMRRILAYSIVNQVGFMVAAVGIGTEMAINGAAAHAFTHIIYKALLLMSAGSVLYMTGARKCSDLGGLYRTMPVTAICGIVGALAISSFPLTSGFVSKGMTMKAAADEGLMFAWLILTAASAGVFLHAGIKFPWFVFFQKDSGMRPEDPPRNMKWAMMLLAFLCVAIGVYPDPLYAILPYPVAYAPYTTAHVVHYLQLLLFGGLAFFVALPLMKRTSTISLDFDWFWRKGGRDLATVAVAHLFETLDRMKAGLKDAAHQATGWTATRLGSEDKLAVAEKSGSMAARAIGFLGFYLALYFFL